MIREDIAIGQDQVLHPAWAIGHCKQWHVRLLGRSVAFAKVAGQASTNDVLPHIAAPARGRNDMIPRQLVAIELPSAVEAKMAITRKQGGIVQSGRGINRRRASVPA